MNRRSFLRFAPVAAAVGLGIPPAIIAAQAAELATQAEVAVPTKMVNITNITMTCDLRCADPDKAMIAWVEPIQRMVAGPSTRF